MARSLPLISIIVPCYNEAANIKPLYDELKTAMPTRRYRFELVFVDDGSHDETINIIRKLPSAKAGKISVVPLELARNFGKEIAITAGLHAAKGEAAIMVDADLQHPPQYIPEFLDAWEAGADIVIGVRAGSGKYAPLFKRLGSKAFYNIINRIAETQIVSGATDYRLIDRSVISEFSRFTERKRLTRGLIDWLGFKRAYVEFEPAERLHGTASYSFRRLVGLAMNSFVAMSLLPLKLTGYIGTIITIVAGVLGVFIIFESYVFNDPWGLHISGLAGLSTLIMFLIGIVMISLGLIALYIATIHTEVMNRPLYVVRTPRLRSRDHNLNRSN